MSVGTISHSRTATAVIPRPEFGRAGKTTIGVLVVLGLGALAGGATLVSRPDGSVMHFDVKLLAGTPFSDYFIPGLILGGLFGIGSFVVAAMGSFLHPTFFAIGAIIAVAAVPWGWATFEAWRSNR